MERLKLSVRFLLLMLFLGCVISSLQASSGALLTVGVIVSIIVVFFISNSLLVADRSDMDASIRKVEALLNYKFKNKKWLEDALTHPSYTTSDSYERLEFLGDSAIALIVSRDVFRAYPDAGPGDMSLIRSENVSNKKLARVAVKHGFDKYLRHKAVDLEGQITEFVVAVEKEEDGEELYGGMVKAPKVLADIVESIAAAIYVDCGMNVEKLGMSFRRLMEPFITLDEIECCSKNMLQELCDEKGWPRPNYRIEKQTGPRHNLRFVCSVQIEVVKDKIVMHGEEKSRVKDAENSAAFAMRKALQSSNYIRFRSCYVSEKIDQAT